MKLPSSDFTICVMIGQTNGNTEVLQGKHLMEDRLERQPDNPPGYLVVASCSLLSLRPEGGQHQVQAREDLSGDVRDRGACSIEVRLGGGEEAPVLPSVHPRRRRRRDGARALDNPMLSECQTARE